MAWFLGYLLAFVIHEVGHALAAWAVGVRVERFFIFYDANDFALLRWRIGGAVVGLGWLFLGAYCAVDERDMAALRPVKRAWVLLAGCLASFVTALVLFVPDELPPVPRALLWWSAGLGVFQLLPLKGHDGRALLDLLTGRTGPG